MNKVLYQTLAVVDASTIPLQISSKCDNCVWDIAQFSAFTIEVTDVRIFLNHDSHEISKQKYAWKAHDLKYSRAVLRLLENASKLVKPFLHPKKATNDKESHTSGFLLSLLIFWSLKWYLSDHLISLLK